MSISTQIQALQTDKTNIRNAIINKGGTSASDNGFDDFATDIATIPNKEVASWHQCPQLVRDYIDNVTYDPSDYTTSQIQNYAPATAVTSNTKPIGKTIDSVTFYNEIPNVQTPFSTTNKAGTIQPLDQVRWLNTNAVNVRDLGGWACDGGTVKYGMLIRGGLIDATDRDVLVNQCGVRAELDFRSYTSTESILGSDIFFERASSYNWYSLLDENGSTASWITNLRFLFDKAKYRIPIYFHCSAGADRTGTFAVVVESLLGMSQSDIDKDYELTDFSVNSSDFRKRNQSGSSYYGGLISEINTLFGSSFQQKVINWVGSLGFSEDDVNTFRRNMIDGNPQDVHFESPIDNLITSYQDNARYSTSGAIKSATGMFVVTNYIARPDRHDVFRIKINGMSASDLTAMLSNTSLYFMSYYSDDGLTFTLKNYYQSLGGSNAWTVELTSGDDVYLLGYSETTKSNVPWSYASSGTTNSWNYFRIGLMGVGANAIITRNQEF